MTKPRNGYRERKARELRDLMNFLDEMREGMRKLEKIAADQDAMLERQTARIVDLQAHIEQLTKEKNT